MTALDQLLDLSRRPFAKSDDRPLIVVFPMWFPVELLIAANLRASEWWGFPSNTSLADAHFPTYICTLVKTNFETLLSGQTGIDGAVFPTATCDSVQNAGGIFHHKFPDLFMAHFRMSQNPESPAAKDYLTYELNRLRTLIGDYAGTEIADEALREAIVTVNDFRRAVAQLLQLLAAGKTSLPASQIYEAIRGALADIGPTTTKMLDQVRESITIGDFSGPKIMLSGMTPEPLDALDAIEAAGGAIVGDDLGLGWRTLSQQTAVEGDPMEALILRLLSAPPCSSLHFQVKRRAEYVAQRVKETGADAVIFTRLKFCDPEAFDYPDIKCFLDEEKIPNLLIERSITDKAEGTIATRLEAFLEQIG